MPNGQVSESDDPVIHALQRALQAAEIRFVRILWCDNANVIRGKAVHVAALESLGHGVGITVAQQALPVMYDAVAPGSGLEPVGEALLAPDWSTFTVLPYVPNHAQVLADMMLDDAPWEHCPRDFLKQQVARMADHRLSLQVAFENEFTLLRRDADSLVPVETSIYATTLAMNESAEVVTAIADALLAQGLEPVRYHPESGPGQQELSVRPAGALEAADRQLQFRETVRGIAARHGLTASFLPKIFENAAGNGCHLNLSLWRGGENLSGDPASTSGLSAEAAAFIAGTLEHLPALAALTLGSCNSYRRLQAHTWAGAFRCWGHGNREAAVRVSLDGGPADGRFEVKTADATGNPYLALGSVLAAGLDGLERGLELPAEVTGDPGNLTEAERTRRGIDPLPSTQGEALAALEANDVLLAALGPARAKAYRAVKRMEWEALEDAGLDDEVELLLERY